MRRTTMRVLATLCCALGVALVVLGATLCPQSLYANQGTANFAPCADGCDSGCFGRNPSNCAGSGGNDGCNALGSPYCNECRCLFVDEPIPYCYCF
jgi:hypothetical protein